MGIEVEISLHFRLILAIFLAGAVAYKLQVPILMDIILSCFTERRKLSGILICGYFQIAKRGHF